MEQAIENAAKIDQLALQLQASTGISHAEAKFRIKSALESYADFDDAFERVKKVLSMDADDLSITASELGVRLKPGEAYAYSMEPDGANGKPILHVKERSTGKVVTPRQKHASGYAKNSWGGTDAFSGPNRKERRAMARQSRG